ncbi:MAG: site-2 protease family protein [Chloroflexi bacterium]|nr:site-2 protease family protein [Chloroflexota bacterium]
MLTSVLLIVAFILLLAVLILVHEAGHFFVAKASGVKVLEFGMGFPPRLWGTQKGETLYSINAIPFGGFVKMVGEEDPSEPRSLAGKSVLTRFLVIAAGPFMNAVTALVLFAVLFMIPQDVVVGKVTVREVAAGSPAEAAGIQPGDQIVSVDGHKLDNQGDVGYRISLKLGEQMEWVVRRDGRDMLLRIMPRLKPPEGEGATGIVVTTLETERVSRSMAPWTAVGRGFTAMADVIIITKNEVTKWLAGGKAPQVAGPIGMAQTFEEVGSEPGFSLKDRAMITFNLAAVISLSLAVFNILPLPALDGGRLPFLLIEWIGRGRRVPPKFESLVHMVGLAVLLGLALVIAVVDIMRIRGGGSLLGG